MEAPAPVPLVSSLVSQRIANGMVQLKAAGYFDGGWFPENMLVDALLKIGALREQDRPRTRSSIATTKDWVEVLQRNFRMKEREQLGMLREEVKQGKQRTKMWLDTELR
eukprot:SAG31_NODE_29894_length_388_cov_1.017301_1_plen_108_part_10